VDTYKKNSMIDLRSDTVTKPTSAMLEAMMKAPVGDDVFGEDPSVNELEKKVAQYFGMEAALFCPSGTMTNQIAIKVHTQPGQEVICHQFSHVYNYEGGGIAYNSGCQVRPVEGPQGKMSVEAVVGALQNGHDLHAAASKLLVAENTTNKGGGACYRIDELAALREAARSHGLSFHLDGARIWNALVALKQNPQDYGRLFDSLSVCMSKGLGAPVGSLLVGGKDFIDQARFVRKKFGGGMRQAGYLAAAALYALENNIDRLAEDHQKAQTLKKALENCSWVEKVEAVETNIVIFYLKAHKSAAQFSEKLKQKGILHTSMGQGKLRFVSHLHHSQKDIQTVKDALAELNQE
jgi:threonine aldolase